MAHTFNGSLKRIYIDSALPNVIVQDLYSDWKEWAVQGDNLQYLQAFRTFGGDPTVEGQTAPAYYFLTNGWRVIVDGFDSSFSFNIYTDEGESPVITINGGTALLNNSDVGIAKSFLDLALEYGGVVYIDVDNGISGQEYPAGTQAQPVNNIADALTICNLYNFNKVQLDSGNVVLNTDVSGITFYGRVETHVEIQAGAILDRTEFRGLEIHGDMGGYYVDIFRCEIDGLLTNVRGHITDTAIAGDITCADNGVLTINNCASYIAGLGRPTINGAPNANCQINLRKYSGGLNIGNLTHADCVMSAEFLAGKCTVLPSCTAGLLSARGLVYFEDQSTGTTVDTQGLISNLIDLTGVTINADALNIDVPTAVEIRAEMDANSSQLAQIVTNTTSISTDAPTVEDIRAYLDTNSTQLAQLITNTTNIATDAPTAAEIRAEIDLNSTQLSAIRTDINDIQVPDYSSQLTSIQTSVDGIPIAPDYTGQLSNIQSTVNSLDIPTTTEIVNEIDTSSTRLATIQAGESTILSAVSNVQTAVNGINIPDYSTELALLQTSVDGINDTDYSVTLANIQGAIGNIPTTDNVVDLTPVLDAISALNDVTPAEVRAAFNEVDFRDKNTEAEIHAWLNSYTNKAAWKADPQDLTPILGAIQALDLITLAEIEASTVLAKEATLSAVATLVGQLENTDITPVLTAINNLNNITAAEVRAAFNTTEFKDGVTETVLHQWLDSYDNTNWKTDEALVAETVWSEVV